MRPSLFDYCQTLLEIESELEKNANLKLLDVLLNPRAVKDRFINTVVDSESSLLLDH